MSEARMIRKEKGMTLKTVAESAGISIQFLADLERGRRSAKPGTWERVANALGVPVADLRGDEHDTVPDHQGRRRGPERVDQHAALDAPETGSG